MASALHFDDPAPEDFTDPDLAPVFATLPAELKRRFRDEFLNATRETAPSLFARVDAEIFFRDVAKEHDQQIKKERWRASRMEKVVKKKPKPDAKNGVRPKARKG